MLIVCEGAQTERLYFESFPMTSLTVKGLGANTLTVVDYAITARDDAASASDRSMRSGACSTATAFPRQR